jgi:hypothetical protein
LIDNLGWDTGLDFNNNIIICFKVDRLGWKFVVSHGIGSGYTSSNNNYSILFFGDSNSISGEFIIRIYYININL